jgi:HD-like signal output (HDOD) protein
MSNRILEKLFAAMQGAKGIPAMERVVTSVLGTINDAKGSNRLLAEHISGDFALTQKVLKLANSAMYAPFAKEASSVTAAVNILGTDALLHVVLSTGIATATEVADDKMLSKTLLASELARSMCPARSEDMSVAGLMYDLGSLMAAKFLPQEVDLIETKVASGNDPDKAAQDVLGMSFQQLGAEVAKRWKLPASIVTIIDGSGDPELVEIARFSNSASSLVLEGKVEEVDKLVSDLSLPDVDKATLSGLIRRKLEEISLDTEASQTSSEASLEKLFKVLSVANWKSLEELAGAMFTGISQAMRTAHCLLFVRMSSGDFEVRYGHGTGIDEPRAKFKVAGEYKPTAFHAVIKNNVDISIANVSKLKPSALPDGYATFFPDIKKFIILPIAQGSVSGLVYCDWDSEGVSNQMELATMKKLRDLFLPFF